MKRIILMVLRLFWIAPFWFIKMCRMANSDRYSQEEKYEILRTISTRASKAGRVTIRAYGTENIPRDQGFIYFPNHQGMYDSLAFLATSPVPLAAVMKKELSNVILVKQAMALMGCLALDRSDVRAGVRVIHEMADRVKAGKVFLIFPEGTRSRQGNQTGEFKAGSFKAALYAKCPIVSVALIDCFKPFDEGHCKPVTVQVHYLEPIPYEAYKDMKTPEIAAMVKEIIDREIARHLGE